MEHSKNVPSILLTRDAYCQVIRDLRRALPPTASDDPDDLLRHNSMMRQACSARSMLPRIQDARRKRAALGIASDEPACSDHGILDRMTEAVRRDQADAPKVGPAGATIPGTTAQGFSLRDVHPPASARPGAPAGDVLPAQTVS